MNYDSLLSQLATLHQESLGRAVSAVNQALVLRNWAMGAYIVEFEQKGAERAAYGTKLLPRLSKDLLERGLTGVSRPELDRCRRFFQLYPQLDGRIRSSLPNISINIMEEKELLICSPVTSKSAPSPLPPTKILQFSWTHLCEFIKLDDPWKRAFYENECLKGKWSVRELQRQIGSLLYERTGLSTDKKGLIAAARKEASRSPQTLAELIRDPYILEFTGLAERPQYRESDLEQALLDHLQRFLLELGQGFCFEARQKRITVGNEHDFIDLVFYHRILRCHLLIDLKIRAFQHGDAGQMNFYLNFWKDKMMAEGDSPPVGLVLCSGKDHTKVQYACAGLDQQLFVSRYLVALPKPEELQHLLENDRAQLSQDSGDQA